MYNISPYHREYQVVGGVSRWIVEYVRAMYAISQYTILFVRKYVSMYVVVPLKYKPEL